MKLRTRTAATTGTAAALALIAAAPFARAQDKKEASPAPSASPAATQASPAPTEKSGATAPKAGASPAASPKPGSSASPTVTVSPSAPIPIAITVNAPPPPAPPVESGANNWAAGILGIGMLVVAGYFGLKYARQRGMTVSDTLKQMGVTMPQDGGGQQVPLKAVAPQPAPLPPLPSLADLPTVAVGPGQAAPGVASVAAAAPPAAPSYQTGAPRLVGIGGPVQGETFSLTGPFTIGRDAVNSLALAQDTGVSRRHARVEQMNGKWTLFDENSSNGSYINKQRVPGSLFLHPGDEIQIGNSRFRFEGQA